MGGCSSFRSGRWAGDPCETSGVDPAIVQRRRDEDGSDARRRQSCKIISVSHSTGCDDLPARRRATNLGQERGIRTFAAPDAVEVHRNHFRRPMSRICLEGARAEGHATRVVQRQKRVTASAATGSRRLPCRKVTQRLRPYHAAHVTQRGIPRHRRPVAERRVDPELKPRMLRYQHRYPMIVVSLVLDGIQIRDVAIAERVQRQKSGQHIRGLCIRRKGRLQELVVVARAAHRMNHHPLSDIENRHALHPPGFLV